MQLDQYALAYTHISGDICRLASGRLLETQALRLLLRRLERSATLALAFCHAHELAVRDLANYGSLAEWHEDRDRQQEEAERLGVADVHLDDLLERMRTNVSQQVRRASRMKAAGSCL